uniref:Uncharacterized protein n=1 Tax=Anguilla anguilla TaxID=7936 RepID=A0A0E9QP70_ANGAN
MPFLKSSELLISRTRSGHLCF